MVVSSAGLAGLMLVVVVVVAFSFRERENEIKKNSSTKVTTLSSSLLEIKSA